MNMLLPIMWIVTSTSEFHLHASSSIHVMSVFCSCAIWICIGYVYLIIILSEIVSVNSDKSLYVMPFVYLFGVLRRFQHCTGYITTGSWMGR